MKVLAEFFWDCGRMGDVEGLFVCEQQELTEAFGKTVNFGEILGKHSEIYGDLEVKDITIRSTDQDFINKLVEIVGQGDNSISGYNPLVYIRDQEEGNE